MQRTSDSKLYLSGIEMIARVWSSMARVVSKLYLSGIEI